MAYVRNGGGINPAGVAFQWPKGQEYTSYRTGDEGSRIQTGWYDYTPPVHPAKGASLDHSLGSNYWWRLKVALTVAGVESTVRFVDVDGGQTWSATGDKDRITIDKLTGLGIYRKSLDLGGAVTWNNAIDNALTFSTTVNSVVYADWYLASLEELRAVIGENGLAGSGSLNLYDTVSSKNVIVFVDPGTIERYWSSTTQSNSSGANAYHVGFNPSTFTVGAGKAGTWGSFLVFDARALIS